MENISPQEALPALVSKADQLYQGGRIAAAVELLTRGIRLVPDAMELYCTLTEMLLEDEQYQAALEVIDDLPDEINEIKKAELSCCCLEGLQRYREAEEVIDPYISDNTLSASLLNLKGVLLFHRKEIQGAQKYFERSIRTDASYGRAYVNLGLLKLGQGEGMDGLELLEKGFILAPRINHTVDTYHELISEIGAYGRAEPLFNDACRRYPGNKKLAYLLIDILLQQNKLKDALDHIQKAIATFGIDDGILEPALKIQNSLNLTNHNETRGNISLCMIVKDEEKNIARCLESVKALVGEIVIVDTGSQDRSKDIARIFGARVYDCEWQSDFSLARNLSLSKANSDWIFILDADEVVAASDHDELKNITRNTAAGPVAYGFTTRNYTNDAGTEGWRINDGEYETEQAGAGWNPSQKVRLFPNDERIRFENAVHEMVEPSLRRIGVPVNKCAVPIHHYGILNQRQTAQKKEKYYSLGKGKLAGKQGDLSTLMECAIQAAEIGEYAEAVTLWEKILKQKPDLPKAYFNLSFAYIQLENYSDGLDAAHKAMTLDADLKEAALNYALCLLRSGKIQKAIGPLEHFLIETPGHPMATGLLAVAHCMRGNGVRGIELFDAVKKQGFNCSEYILDHARKLVSAGKVRHAVALIECVSKSCYNNRQISSLLVALNRFEIDTPRLKIRLFDLRNDFLELRNHLRPLSDFYPGESKLFALPENDSDIDFIFFPYSIDSLFHHLGREEFIGFFNHLKGFKENEHKFVFFLLDDIRSPLDIRSVIYRVNHDRRKMDINSITLPYFVEDLFRTPVLHDLPYHSNFVGTPVTHLIRAYMLLPFLGKKDLAPFSTLLEKMDELLALRKNEIHYQTRLSDALSLVQKIFPIDPVVRGLRYFFDISVDQFPRLPEHIQKAKKAELVDLINQSISTLCPRGFGVQSIRFFETLSAGRIPILISDNYSLPLENHINYSDFIWKVDEGKIMELPKEIAGLFESHSGTEIIERAKKAREAWQNMFAPPQRLRFIYRTLAEVLKNDYRLNGRPNI